MEKVLFVATVTSHIVGFHIPYLKLFKERGYEVHVASNGDEKIEYCDKHFNLPFQRFPFKIENVKVYKQLKKIIDENNYKIIHCHTPVGGVLARLAARKARKNGTKVIYTAHGFHFFKGAPIINWMIYYPIEKIIAKFTDCLITINKEDYEFAKKHFNIENIEYVHGVGVDENKFNKNINEEEKARLKSDLGVKENEFVIIYPAELSKRKNQGMLLKVVSKLKKDGVDDVKVLLPGSDSMNGAYQEMAKELKIDSMVKFLGYRKDIPKLMNISDLAVSTSRQEGLPVNLIEAMMMGLPIIATDCRGNRDLTKETVKIDDVNDMEEKIILYMKNKDQNVRYKKEKYKLKNVLREMEKIYLNE